MKRILKFILVQRDGLENKWWHRLSKVIIFGSAIVVFLISAFVIFSDSESDWKSYTYNAYSFEANYTNVKGKEIGCEFHKSTTPYTSNETSSYLTCDDFGHIKIEEFLPRYNHAVREKFGIDKEVCDSHEKNELGKLTDSALKCVREKYDLIPVRPTSFLDEITFDQNLKTKKQTHVDYIVLLKITATVILITVSWFIFWESIVYRACIYIILGNKRNL